MVVWRGVQGGSGVFFQTYSKTHANRLQIVCKLLILRSAGGWCLVIDNVFHTFSH